MLHTYTPSAPRRAVVLTGIIGLHVGVFLIVAADRLPPVPPDKGSGPVVVHVKPPPPAPIVRPPPPQLGPVTVTRVERPDIVFPEFPHEIQPDTTPFEPGAGPVQAPKPDIVINPTIAMRGSRLAALIDACYPASSRRTGEEGKAIVRLVIGANGKLESWQMLQGTGFPRLDSAIGCVVEALVFTAGSRNGSAVRSEAILPIVFRLN